MKDVIVTTTNGIDGKKVEEYIDVVAGEAVMGANVVKDFFAGIRDIVGGRSGSYEKEIKKGRYEALKDLKSEGVDAGADAVVGVSVDYEEMGEGMLWMTATGTAVKLTDE